MPSFSTIDFAVFCLTVIALVAIAHQKDEIAAKAVSVIERIVAALGNAVQRLECMRRSQYTKGAQDDQKFMSKAQDPSLKNPPRRKRRSCG